MHSHLLTHNTLARSVVVCSTFVSNEGIILAAAAFFQNLLTMPCDNILGERHFFCSSSDEEIAALILPDAKEGSKSKPTTSSFDVTVFQQRNKEARAAELAGADVLAVLMKALVTFAENSVVVAAVCRCLAVLLQSFTVRTRMMQQHSDFIDVTMRLWMLYADNSSSCSAFASMFGSFTSLSNASTVAKVESAGAIPVIMRALSVADSKMSAQATNGAADDDAAAYAEDILCCVRWVVTSCENITSHQGLFQGTLNKRPQCSCHLRAEWSRDSVKNAAARCSKPWNLLPRHSLPCSAVLAR
jgi:hypothetical protein